MSVACWTDDQNLKAGCASPQNCSSEWRHEFHTEQLTKVVRLEDHLCRQDAALMQLLTAQTRAESVLDQISHSLRSVHRSMQVRTYGEPVEHWHDTNKGSAVSPMDVLLDDRGMKRSRVLSDESAVITSDHVLASSLNTIQEERLGDGLGSISSMSFTHNTSSINSLSERKRPKSVYRPPRSSLSHTPSAQMSSQASTATSTSSVNYLFGSARSSKIAVYLDRQTRSQARLLSELMVTKACVACCQNISANIRWIVQMTVFDLWCALLIIFNAVIVGMETEMTSEDAAEHGAFFYIQYFLNVWFTLELLLRIAADGVHFFVSPEWRWNLFDCALVTSCVVDMCVSTVEGSGLQVGRVFRAVRLLRIVRTLRIVRILQYIFEFRKMAYALACSVKTLLWALLLLFFVMYTFAIWFTQGAIDSLQAEGHHEELDKYYGSIGRSIYSLYMAITNGMSWGYLIDPLFEREQWSLVSMFFVYISICVWGVLNVLTAVFVESAMQTTQHYRDLMVQDKMLNKELYISHILQIFEQIDTDRSGTISTEELESFFEDDDLQLRSYFEALELNPTDARALFKLMDLDGSGAVDMAEFCQGCLRLKGEARSFDLQCLIHEQRCTTREVLRQMEELRYRMVEMWRSQCTPYGDWVKRAKNSPQNINTLIPPTLSEGSTPPIVDERASGDEHLQ